MTLIKEKTQIKFKKSPESGELIGFVSRNPRTHKLRGVYEDSQFSKSICVLSNELKGLVLPDRLYWVELKQMHKKSGFVVVAAEPALFPAQIETKVVPKAIYKVGARFGLKTIIYDPIDGKSPSSRTLEGALKALAERTDVKELDNVLIEFRRQGKILIRRMQNDGYLFVQ